MNVATRLGLLGLVALGPSFLGCGGGPPWRSNKSAALTASLNQVELDNKQLRSQLEVARSDAQVAEDELNQERAVRKKLATQLADSRRRSGDGPALPSEGPPPLFGEEAGTTVPAAQPSRRRPPSIQIPGQLLDAEEGTGEPISEATAPPPDFGIARRERTSQAPWLRVNSATARGTGEPSP